MNEARLGLRKRMALPNWRSGRDVKTVFQAIQHNVSSRMRTLSAAPVDSIELCCDNVIPAVESLIQMRDASSTGRPIATRKPTHMHVTRRTSLNGMPVQQPLTAAATLG
jgi:hypothetical protein